MALRQKNHKRFSLSIGMRLALAFMTIILLTGLIGFLAIQQFSALTSTTTELNSRDLPEVITLVHLRSSLFRQRDFELSLVNATNVDANTPDAQGVPGPTSTPTVVSTEAQNKQTQLTISSLQSVLKDIAKYRQQLQDYERPDAQNLRNHDIPLVNRAVVGVLSTSATSRQIQTLVDGGQLARALTIEYSQQAPALASTLDAITQLGTLEQNEARTAADQMQQESGRSTVLVFLLTTLCLLLSILLALVITRSLTKPLKSLLRATDAIADGDLTVDPQIARGDEIGRLASAYDKMRLSLRSTIASLTLERQHTQAVIDATADGVILVDEKLRILKFNPAAEHLCGWPVDEAIGCYCWEVLGCKDPATVDQESTEQSSPLLAALLTHSEQSEIEMAITSRTGQQRWLAISCAPMPTGEQIDGQQMVIGLHDISQLKAVEQLKTDFVTMVSHELRAPLTTVTGSVEMLGQLDPGADNELYHEVLNILDQQTRRLREVVEEVLQLTRFDAGRLEVHLQPLSISRLIQGVADRMRSEWTGDTHCIIVREPTSDIRVWADSGLLEIVFRNLFDNARKYTPQGTPIEVETELDTATNQVRIRVSDHGPGISADQIDHIFKRFSRGSQSSYHWTRGYGLGLYIVRELLQAHNGTIQVQNLPEGGACFILSLWTVTDDTPPVIPHNELKDSDNETIHTNGVDARDLAESVIGKER